MGGAAAGINVDSVGVMVDDVRLKAGEPGKQPGGGGRGRAVGAVGQNPQAGKSSLHRGDQMVQISLQQRRIGIRDPAQQLVGLEGNGGVGAHNRLDGLLQRVGKLVALGIENFNAVMLKGVVGGGNDNTRVGLGGGGHPSHGWGGHHAQPQHVGARRAEAGGQRALQHIRGNARVLANGKQRPCALLFLRQHMRRRLPNPKSQKSVQPLIYNAADTVGAK
ncbi:hypothetical protein SDC9_105315 [bioreactor metagenome]|uniref:Uncharacterized protein n=1 Tax=bioreactor metagenome TaxID=1076179 RepID=A0A645B9Y5_9ZZZZ